MKYFNTGRLQFSNDFCEIVSDADYRSAFQKFESKFWGCVDSDTYHRNNEAAMSDEGEIIAKYECSNEVVVHFITFPDRKYTYICTTKDLENGEFEKFKARVEETRRRFSELYSITTAKGLMFNE
jgi:hypothetical protein